MRHLKRFATKIGFLLFGVIILALLFVYDPAQNKLFPPCPFHLFTGLYCPGCGSLRAVHCLFNGDFRQAFAFNPLMVVSIPFLLILISCPKWAYKPWVAWLCLAVLVGYGILRNIHFWPFFLLAPG